MAVGDVATTLQTMLGGTRASTFTRENKLFDVLMQLDPSRRATPQDMDNLFVRGRDGSLEIADGSIRRGKNVQDGGIGRARQGSAAGRQGNRSRGIPEGIVAGRGQQPRELEVRNGPFGPQLDGFG